MFINVNDLNIYYETLGQGEPLIMIHGNGEDHKIFTRAVAILKEHYTCYLIDSRGHGQSTKVKEYHYDNMADDIYKFIMQLDLKDVNFYGFSDGGIIGLLLASKYPSLLKRMVISGANTKPEAVKPLLIKVFKFINKIKFNPLFTLMLNEPHITKEELNKIITPTLVLAGDKDLILKEETLFIHDSIKNSKLMILPKENHASYIVNSTKIAYLILDFLKTA